jgi:hypothetical protein
MPQHKIDIAIIGVQKAATTSLHRYMGLHPDVLTHERLEFAFFVDDDEFADGYDKAYSKYFTNRQIEKKLLIKNVGIIYWEDALKRLQEHNPDARLILVLRNPVDRAYSAFQYAKMMGFEKANTFEEAINQDLHAIKDKIIRGTVDYLGRGDYADQLTMLFKYFPENQVKVLLQEDLQRDPTSVLKSCFAFCGLDDGFTPDFTKKFNESGRSRIPLVMQLLKRTRVVRKKISFLLPTSIRQKLLGGIERMNRQDYKPEPIKLETRDFLIRYYQEKNIQLGQLLKRDLSEWNQVK